jgi:hypothetical protein
MSRRALVMLGLLSVVALPATAAEFVPGWDVTGVWDSNVFRTETDPEDDFSLRTGPILRLREEQGDFVYDLNYRVLYEAFAKINGANTFDQYASGSGTWTVTPNTRIFASDDFAYTSSLEGLFQTTGDITTLVPRRTRVTANGAEASLTHQFGSVWEFRASVGSQIYDYRDPDQSDTTSTRGTLQLTRSFTPRLIAGVGAQYQRQEFASVPANPGNGTTFYQGFGVLDYSISPTWKISVQAGPAWAVPDVSKVNSVNLPAFFNVDPTTCPKNAAGTPVFLQFPQSAADVCGPAFYSFLGIPIAPFAPASPGDRTDVPFVGEQSVSGSLNYFGQIRIEKYWRQWRASLEYSRNASNGSGLSTSTTLDQLTGTVRWSPTRLWDVDFTAIYSLQASVSDVRQREVSLSIATDTQTFPGTVAVYGIPFEVGTGAKISSDAEVTAYFFRLNAVRRISRHLSLRGGASYWQQETGGLLQTARVPQYRVDVGFTWNFEPIPL